MSLALPPAPDPSKKETVEITYSLPKTYNGKTVFDLFPEFKEDSVALHLFISYLLSIYKH